MDFLVYTNLLESSYLQNYETKLLRTYLNTKRPMPPPSAKITSHKTLRWIFIICFVAMLISAYVNMSDGVITFFAGSFVISFIAFQYIAFQRDKQKIYEEVYQLANLQ